MNTKESLGRAGGWIEAALAGSLSPSVRRVMHIELSMSLAYGVFYATIFPFTQVVLRRMGATVDMLAIYTALLFAGSVFTSFSIVLMRRRRTINIIVFCWLLGRSLFLLTAFVTGAVQLMAIGVVFGLLEAFVVPAYTRVIQKIYPESGRGKVMSTVRMGRVSVILLVTPLAGWALDRVGYQVLFPIGALFGILATYLFTRIDLDEGELPPRQTKALSDLWQIVRGDFGVSLITKEYVSTLIGHSLSITLQLTAVSMVMVVLIAFPTGIISAVKRNSISDMLSRIFSLLGISMPNFWLALLFITFIAVGLGWFPPGGYVSPEKGFGPWLQALILPSLSIAAAPASALSRMVRASMLDVLSKDYIRTARAKGQRERWVVLRHALRNSMMAPMTIIGMQVGYLMGGAIIVEVIFFFPGMGRLLLEAGIDQDYSVVQGVALVSAVAFILVNVLVDFLYMLIDPRIRDSQ